MSGTYILTIVLYMSLVMFTIQFQELSIADYNRCVVVLGKVWPMQVSLLVLSINLYTSIIVAYKQFFCITKSGIRTLLHMARQIHKNKLNIVLQSIN